MKIFSNSFNGAVLQTRIPLLFNIKWLICLLLSVHSIATLSQSSGTRFNRITINQGLSLSSVYCIYQDSKGFMWFGSRKGLSGFDPVREIFYQYHADAQDPESLVNDTVTALAEDAGNHLWVGTAGGLSRINITTGAIERVAAPGDGTHNINSKINALLPDDKGNLWIGTDYFIF